MRGWSRRTVAVVLVALMVATATPAMAADPGLEVVSQHTTDTDFNNAATLDSVSVQGSGTGADILYEQGTLLDGFEDGDISEYTGDTTSFNVQSTTVHDGSNALEVTANNVELISSSGLPGYPQAGDTITFWVRGDNADTGLGFQFGRQDANNFYRVEVDPADNTFGVDKFDAGSSTKSDTASPSLSTSTWYQVQIEWGSGGTIQATILDSGGSQLASVSISDTSYTSGAIAWTSFPSSGAASGYFDTLRINGDSTGQYVSANHTAEEVQQGFIDLTISGSVEAVVTWEYWDGSSWQAARTDTFTSSGNKTVSLSQTTTKWRVDVTFQNGGAHDSATIEDEGVQFQAATPSVDNTTASPSGGENVTSETMTLSIDVSDADFPLAQSDQLTLEWYVDGSKVDTTTESSNGTASTTVTTPGGGGTHTWHVVVTDSYGDSTTSNTFSFETPSTLFIRNESNVSQLVDNVTVELTFYFRNGTGQDFSVTKTTSDGTVNMTGLPTDQPFVVVADADGYYSRRIFVPSLFETQTVYLLPQNETAVDTVFVIEDYTGDFPPDDTVLLVQRSLNGTWRTVLGDYFGATREFPGQVAYNERHRLVLMNVETGETRVMGTYTPITAATQEVVVSPSGDLTVRTAGATAAIRPQFGQLPALNGTTVAVRFENNSASVANWTVNATVNGTTVWLQTYASPQRVTNDLDLAPYAGETLTVRVTYNDTNGTTFLVSERTFQVQQTLDNNATLLAAIQDFAQQSPQQNRGSFTAFLAMAITVLGMAGVASQFPVSSEVVALAGVFILTGFSVIGWVGYGLVFAAGVGTIAFAGLKRGL